jgi:hypothetical protein
MSNPRKTFSLDKDRVTKGVRFELDGVGYTMAYAGKSNTRWLKTVDRVFKPHRHSIQLEALPKEKQDELSLEVFVESLLLSWDGMTDDDGNTVAFSKEAAKELLTDLPELYDNLSNLCAQAKHYRAGVIETDTKN